MRQTNASRARAVGARSLRLMIARTHIQGGPKKWPIFVVTGFDSRFFWNFRTLILSGLPTEWENKFWKMSKSYHFSTFFQFFFNSFKNFQNNILLFFFLQNMKDYPILLPKIIFCHIFIARSWIVAYLDVSTNNIYKSAIIQVKIDMLEKW